MKLYSLISAVVLGMAVHVHAQEKPVPPAPKPAVGLDGSVAAAGGRPVGAYLDLENRMETLILKAGPLTQVVAQVERCFKDDPKKPDVDLPNLVYAKDTLDAVVPGDLTLRHVTPVQALALVAAAAGCTFQPIMAPDEAAGREKMIIGYRIVLPNAANAKPRPAISGLSGLAEEGLGGGIGITLTKIEGGVAVGHASPGSPASQVPAIQPGRLILSVAEAGKPDVDVSGLELEKVVQLIRGQPGTPVKITLAPDPARGIMVPQPVQLVRVKLPALSASGSLPQMNAFGAPAAADSSDVTFLGEAPREKMLIGRIVDSSDVTFLGEAPRFTQLGEALRLTQPLQARENVPFVRVYALGSILSGSKEEITVKERRLAGLVDMAIGKSEPDTKTPPALSFHSESRALIVKATAAQHEIVEQVVKVLKENETQPAASAKP